MIPGAYGEGEGASATAAIVTAAADRRVGQVMRARAPRTKCTTSDTAASNSNR
jgi:hypothetical protein